MPITPRDIREALMNVTADMIPDVTIRQAIRLANTKINQIKRPNISVQDSDSATLMYATFLAYELSTTKMVRQLGSLPLDVQQTLVMLRVTAEEYINEIRWNRKGKPVIGLTGSTKDLWETTTGETETDYSEEE